MATFCLVHGAWHGGSCWDPLVERLRGKGHEALAPDLALEDPATGFEERARPAIEAVEGFDGPVIVGHSQGSAYATLVAAARPDSLLVHLCPRLGGFAPPPGAPEAIRPGFQFPPDRPDGTSAWEADAAITTLYGRLQPDAARTLAERLRPMAMPAGEYPLAEPPDIPTVLVYAAEDEFFEPAWERFMARELLGVEPIEISGGHFPMVEDPRALADLLDRLARERPG